MSTPRELVFELPRPGGWTPRTDLGARALELVAADPGGTLLVSDFDGTLAAIVADPADARMEEASREHLARLAPHLKGLAVVTGREVDVVRELADFEHTEGFEQVVVLGQYGQESWDAATGEVTVPPVPQGVREALAELQQLLAAGSQEVDLTGVALEDKGRGVGVHTRRAADPEACLAWLQGPVAEIATRHGLVIEPGRNVVELRSSTITKGDAVAALVERFRPSVVVMMGDDLGDLPAFAAVRALNEQGIPGISVVSASAEQPGVAEQADVLCSSTPGIAAWLGDLAEKVTAGRH